MGPSNSSDQGDDEAESGLGSTEFGGDLKDTAVEGEGLKRSRHVEGENETGWDAHEAETGLREQREEMQARKRLRLTEKASGEVDRDELTKKLEEWTKVGCSVCWAQGQIHRARRARGWKQCKEHDEVAEKKMEEVTRTIEQLQMARFSGCNFCWVPQSICQRWEEKTAAKGSKTAGYQRSRIAGAGCQYKGVIGEIGGAVISQRMGVGEAGEGREWEWVEEEMKKAVGFWEGGGRDEEEWGRLWRWVVRKRVTNMMETSELVRTLYHTS